MTTSRLRELASMLRRDKPTRHPVEIRRARMPGLDFGDCDLIGSGKRRRFLIRLNSRAPVSFQELGLLHEWSHARTWGAEASDHGALFAEEFAGIIRWYQNTGEWE